MLRTFTSSRTDDQSVDDILPRKERYYRYCCLAFSASLILVALYCRIRLFSLPLERDEGGFAYVGQQLLRGIPPFESGNTMKLMGIHTAYAVMLKLFGSTGEGIRLGLLLVNQISILLVFFLARRLMSLESALIAGGLFALLSISPAVLGISAHATHFVTMFALAGLITLLAVVERPRSSLVFLCGIFLGLSVTMKQNGIFFCAFALAYLLIGLRSRQCPWPTTIRHAAILSGGMVLPYAAVCGYMFYTGVFAEFWFWTVTYSLEYAGDATFAQGVSNFTSRFIAVTVYESFILLLGGAGAVSMMVTEREISRRLFSPALFLVSLVAITPGLYFYPHYFVLVLPAVAFLAAYGADTMKRLFGRVSGSFPAGAATLICLSTAAIGAVTSQRDYYFSLPPDMVSKKLYKASPFPETLEVARYIKANSDPAAQIAVIGSEPQIYFYADRTAATDYLFMYSLAEEGDIAWRMQQEMMAEIEKASPEYIVLVSSYLSWLFEGNRENEIIDRVENYMADNYEQVGLVDLSESGSSSYYWGADAIHRSPSREECLLVFRRKS